MSLPQPQGADSFPSARGRVVIEALVATIDTNAALLSEIDGAIGDGDHGVNMRKGFLLVRDRLDRVTDLASGFDLVGQTLLDEIGGAMGPLYGSFFVEMGEACRGAEAIDRDAFGRALDGGLAIVRDLGGAAPGDKTLLDTLVPARDAFRGASDAGLPFAEALARMSDAAEAGRDSTRDMVARVGRASRLGERSRGVLDAGATSCCLLLGAMASSMRGLLGAGT